MHIYERLQMYKLNNYINGVEVITLHYIKIQIYVDKKNKGIEKTPFALQNNPSFS